MFRQSLCLVSPSAIRVAKKSLWIIPLFSLLWSFLPASALAQATVGYYKGRGYICATVTSNPVTIASNCSGKVGLPPQQVCYDGDIPASGTGETLVGEPVDPVSGAVVLKETFGVIPGRVPFPVGWIYRTKDGTNGPMGIGTSMTTDYFIRKIDNADIYELVTPGNRHYLFYPEGTDPPSAAMNLSVGSPIPNKNRLPQDSAQYNVLEPAKPGNFAMTPQEQASFPSQPPSPPALSSATKYSKVILNPTRSASGSLLSGTLYRNLTDPEMLGAVLYSENGVWKIRWKRGMVFEFTQYTPGGNSYGLSRVVDPFGNAVTVTRDSRGYATVVRNEQNTAYSITLTYSGGAQLKLSQVWLYGTYTQGSRVWQIDRYDDAPFAGQFKRIAAPGLATQQANYFWEVRAGQPYISSAIDRNGNRRFTNYYDSQHRLRSHYIGPKPDGFDGATYRIEYWYDPNITYVGYYYPNPHTGNTTRAGEWYAYTKNTFAGYQITSRSNTLGQVTNYQYNDPSNRHLVTAITDYRGRQWTYTYDSNGNVTQITEPKVSPSNPSVVSGSITTTIQYNATWNIPTLMTFPGPGTSSRQVSLGVNATTGNIDWSRDANNNLKEYTYTVKGDLEKVRYPVTSANGVTTNYEIWYRYYGTGNPATETGEPMAVVGPGVAPLDPVNPPYGTPATRFAYDNSLRVQYLWDAKNNVTQFDYTAMDQLERVLRFYRSDPFNSGSPLDYTETLVGHDAEGNIRTLRNGNQGVWTWVYDGRDRPLTLQNPLGIYKVFSWDYNDALRESYEVKYPDSASVDYGKYVKNRYDDIGRLLETEFGEYTNSFVPQTESYIQYQYHPTTSLVTAITDTNYGTLNYTYDILDRQRSIGGVNGSVGWSMQYTYDEVDRLTRTDYGGGGYVQYQYDNNDNLLTSQQNGGAYVQYTYDELDRLKLLGRPNNTQTKYLYNVAGDLVSETTYRGGTVQIHNRGYTPDLVGNIVAESTGASFTPAYLYDDLNRLVQAEFINYVTGEGMLRYRWTYDKAGNRTQQTKTVLGTGVTQTTAYNYDTANRLTGIVTGGVTTPVTADLSGNITSMGDAYAWNARGELTGVTRSSGTQTFRYDALGRRYEKTEPGLSALYFWDGWGLYYDIMNGVGRATWTGPSGSTQEVVLRGDMLALENQQGSIIGLMDWSGNLVQRFEYAPFGETVYSSGPVPNYPYRFTGLEADANDLYYVRNRYYSPKIGRFLSEDPIGFLGGSNMFAYVGNNPVTFADPLGLWRIGEFEFDGETVGGGLATSAAAFGSYMSGGLYDGGPFRCKPGFEESANLFELGFLLLDLRSTLVRAGAHICLWKGCFAPGTLVLMADGTVKPIEDVRSGDWILSKSDTTGAVEAKQVTDILERQVLETLVLKLSNGLTIETTEEHPFWVEGKGWVGAGQLAKGNSIVTRASSQDTGKKTSKEQSVKVVSAEKKPGLKTVFNLDIDDSHSYFVGNAKHGWTWVHNAYKQARLHGERGQRLPGMSLSEAKRLMGQWRRDPGRGTRAASLRYHFKEHGRQVGANNVWQYMRKAEGFNNNLQRVRPKPVDNNAMRSTKEGKYIIKDSIGRIVSFGLENR